MVALLVVLLCVLLCALLYLLAILPRVKGRPDAGAFRGAVFAHRGLFDNRTQCPENSLAAFQRALSFNVGIELDVQMTSDGIPVVFHDSTLKRMARYAHGKEPGDAYVQPDGTFAVGGSVSDHTFAELQELHLLDTAEKIPMLTQVLNLVGGRVPLIVEIKSETMDAKLCERVDRILRAYRGAYCVESFNPYVLYWYRMHRTKVLRGQLADAFHHADPAYRGLKYKILEYLLFNWLSKPDFIAYNHEYAANLSRTICCGPMRALSAAWTAKTQREMDMLRTLHQMVIFEGFVPEV